MSDDSALTSALPPPFLSLASAPPSVLETWRSTSASFKVVLRVPAITASRMGPIGVARLPLRCVLLHDDYRPVDAATAEATVSCRGNPGSGSKELPEIDLITRTCELTLRFRAAPPVPLQRFRLRVESKVAKVGVHHRLPVDPVHTGVIAVVGGEAGAGLAALPREAPTESRTRTPPLPASSPSPSHASAKSRHGRRHPSSAARRHKASSTPSLPPLSPVATRGARASGVGAGNPPPAGPSKRGAAVGDRGRREEAPLGEAEMDAALLRNDPGTILRCIECGVSPDYESPQGFTPLARAAFFNDTWLIASLLRRGASVDKPTSAGHTAMTWACTQGHSALVSQLLRAGADPALETAGGRSPLHVAAENGQPAIAEALLEAGARVDAPLSTDGQTPLIRATIHRRPAVIALLLSRGALLSPRDESGMAALDHAEALGRSGCARALRLESLRRTWPVRGGGREGRGGEEGRSAPDGNSSGGDWEQGYRQCWERGQLKRMAAGAAPQAASSGGEGEGGGDLSGAASSADNDSAARAALLAVASFFHVVQALSPARAREGVEPSSRHGEESKGGTGAQEQVEAEGEGGEAPPRLSDQHESDEGDAAPQAAGRGDVEVVGSEIAGGELATAAAAGSAGEHDRPSAVLTGTGPLEEAGEEVLASELSAAWGWEVAPGECESAILHRLVRSLEEEEDVTRQRANLRGHADWAIHAHQWDVFFMLVDKEIVHVDHETPAGATLLNTMARGGDEEADVDRALARRPELDKANKDGMTALMFAAASGALASLRTLLHRGAQAFVRDRKQRAAIHHAAMEGRANVVTVLLQLPGADVTLRWRDATGATPVVLAGARGHEACAELLAGTARSLAKKARAMHEESRRLRILDSGGGSGGGGEGSQGESDDTGPSAAAARVTDAAISVVREKDPVRAAKMEADRAEARALLALDREERREKMLRREFAKPVDAVVREVVASRVLPAPALSLGPGTLQPVVPYAPAMLAKWRADEERRALAAPRSSGAPRLGAPRSRGTERGGTAGDRQRALVLAHPALPPPPPPTPPPAGQEQWMGSRRGLLSRRSRHAQPASGPLPLGEGLARNLSGSLPGRPADSVTPFVLGRLQAEMAAQQAALRQRVLGRAAAQRGKGGAAARSSRWDYVEAGTGRKVKAGAQLGASVSLAASVLEQLRATLGHSSSSEVAGAPTPELVSSNAGAPQGRETRPARYRRSRQDKLRNRPAEMELAEHHMRTNVPQKAIPLLQQLLESQREEAGEGVRGALTEPVIHTLLLLGRAQAQMARLRAVQADPKARADAQSMPVADPVTAVPLRAGTAAERGAWFALRGVRPALRRARTTWQEALEALCRTQGPAAEETLGALDLVAGAEVEEGRFTNAFAHVQEWLHRVRREHGRRHEGVQLMRDMSSFIRAERERFYMRQEDALLEQPAAAAAMEEVASKAKADRALQALREVLMEPRRRGRFRAQLVMESRWEELRFWEEAECIRRGKAMRALGGAHGAGPAGDDLQLSDPEVGRHAAMLLQDSGRALAWMDARNKRYLLSLLLPLGADLHRRARTLEDHRRRWERDEQVRREHGLYAVRRRRGEHPPMDQKQRTSAMVDLLLEAQSVVEQAWIRDGVLQRFLDSPPPAEAVEEEEEEEEGGEGALPAGYGEGAEAGVSLPPDAGSEEVARAAATVQRCVRRWLARYEAMVLTNQRYYATLDEGSGCYYYIDDWTGETSWYPPLFWRKWYEWNGEYEAGEDAGDAAQGEWVVGEGGEWEWQPYEPYEYEVRN